VVFMIVKKHFDKNGLLIAVCDSDLLGKKFEEGKLQLDLTSDFYKGQEMDELRVQELMKSARVGNIVGKKSTTLAKKLGLIEKTKTIADIPYALFVSDV